jgi:chromate transporter
VTPGPVFTAATFIGYVLAGLGGAGVATVAIFLPAFVLVALSGPLVPRLRGSTVAGAFLDGVNVASLALMVLVTYRLGRAAIVDGPSLLLAVGGGVALFSRRVGAGWVVLGAAVVGLLRQA